MGFLSGCAEKQLNSENESRMLEKQLVKRVLYPGSKDSANLPLGGKLGNGILQDVREKWLHGWTPETGC